MHLEHAPRGLPNVNTTGTGRTRRTFLKNASTVAGAVAINAEFLREALSSTTLGNRPNLVFFLGEGVRWDESSLAGNKLLRTPNIDRIGREGVVFKNAF